jgi:hypothetical protein
MGYVFVLLTIFCFTSAYLSKTRNDFLNMHQRPIRPVQRNIHQINALIQIIIRTIFYSLVNVVNMGQFGLMVDAKFNEIVEKIKYGLVMIAFANMGTAELVIYAKK